MTGVQTCALPIFEGKIEIEMRKHETISNYLKRLVGIADDLSNDKIKLDMLENGRTKTSQAEVLATDLNSKVSKFVKCV